MSVEALSGLSNNAMYAAIAVYALAFVAHVVEWSAARQLPAADQAKARTGEVLAGVGSGAPPAVTEPDPDDNDAESSDRFGRIGFSLTVLAVLLHGIGVVTRGVAGERVPWGSMYEFTISSTFCVVLAYLVAVRWWNARWLGLLVSGFTVSMLGVAVLWLYRPIVPLAVALDSAWLVIHVIAAVIASGAFTVGALASVLYLVKARTEERAAAHPERPRKGLLWRMPASSAIDRLAYRVHAFAFPIWTFAVLIAGPIWAKYAWGRAWGWDPKEVWAFITWVVYAAYLHARATAGWKGSAAAWVAIAGFGTFLFSYFGVNLWGSGLHTYSGL